jgi:hypothetical protein
MMKPIQYLLVGALIGTVLVSTGRAGTIIVLNTEALGDAALSGSATVYADQKRVRIDSKESGGDVTLIYIAMEQENPFYWFINNKDSSYIEVRRDDVLKAKAEAKAAMDAAMKQLGDLPPDEREQMEKMLGDQTGYTSFQGLETEYREVSRGTNIGQWECDHYQGFRDGEKIEEVWAASLDELGIDPKDLGALEAMAGFFQTVGQAVPAFFRFGGEKSEGNTTFPGFPVMTVSYKDGQRKEKSQVTEVRSEKLNADLFLLPEGLSKRSPPRVR